MSPAWEKGNREVFVEAKVWGCRRGEEKTKPMHSLKVVHVSNDNLTSLISIQPIIKQNISEHFRKAEAVPSRLATLTSLPFKMEY